MKTIKIILALCFINTIYAQDAHVNRNQLSLVSGIGTGQWKDQSYSPLVYDLGSMQIELNFQHLSKHGNIWDFELQSWAARLSNDANEKFETDLLGLDLKFSYLWKLTEEGNYNFHLGPRYKAGSQIITWEDDYELSSAYSYFSTSNLALTARFDYHLERWNFSAVASLPLIATNSRPEYSGFNNGSDEHILNYLFDYVQWHTPDQYFAPEVALSADFKIVEWLALKAKYEGAYTQLNDSEKIAFFTHQFMLGLNFKF